MKKPIRIAIAGGLIGSSIVETLRKKANIPVVPIEKVKEEVKPDTFILKAPEIVLPRMYDEPKINCKKGHTYLLQPDGSSKCRCGKSLN